MSSNSLNNLHECPFSYNCDLPVNTNSCNFPEYKVCPEYQVKLKKLKTPSGAIH